MWVQRMTRFLGRMIFYMLMGPLLIALVYTLANDLWTAALIILALGAIVLYNGLVRIHILENSVAVRDGKVAVFFPEKTVRNRFDFASRGQTVIQLPHFGLLDRRFKMEIFAPDTTGELNSCRLSLDLDYIMELTACQRAYDTYVLYQDQLPAAVRTHLFQSASRLGWPFPALGEDNGAEYLKPVVAELNRGLENFGLKIVDATCTFTTGRTLVRYVAAEQETAERVAAAGGTSREGAGPT